MQQKDLAKVKSLLQQAMDMVDSLTGQDQQPDKSSSGGMQDDESDDQPSSSLALKLAKYKAG